MCAWAIVSQNTILSGSWDAVINSSKAPAIERERPIINLEPLQLMDRGFDPSKLRLSDSSFGSGSWTRLCTHVAFGVKDAAWRTPPEIRESRLAQFGTWPLFRTELQSSKNGGRDQSQRRSVADELNFRVCLCCGENLEGSQACPLLACYLDDSRILPNMQKWSNGFGFGLPTPLRLCSGSRSAESNNCVSGATRRCSSIFVSREHSCG